MTLTNVQLGQSQCDGKISSTENNDNILQTLVVIIAAAVYHTSGPTLEGMRKDIASMKNDIDTLNERVR